MVDLLGRFLMCVIPRRLRSGLIVSVLLFSPLVIAQEYDPWLNPEVLRAAWEIGVTAEEQLEFRSAVTDFLQGYGADVRRLLNGNNRTDLPRKIARKRRVRVKAMDERIALILTDHQIPRYETYRDLLLKKMDERAANRRR